MGGGGGGIPVKQDGINGIRRAGLADLDEKCAVCTRISFMRRIPPPTCFTPRILTSFTLPCIISPSKTVLLPKTRRGLELARTNVAKDCARKKPQIESVA